METISMEEYITFLESYCVFLDTVAETQKKHLEALLTHDIPTIDASTARQQAVVMQLKSYEDSRGKKQLGVGLPVELTLGEIAQRLDGVDGQRVRSCLGRLRDTTGQIEFINDKIQQTVATNLRIINMTAPVEQRREAQRYHEDGKQTREQGSSGIFGTEV